MGDTVRLALEFMLFGGVVFALVGSVVCFLHEGIGHIMVRLGTMSLLAFAAATIFILAL
jgi:hypothetical protein